MREAAPDSKGQWYDLIKKKFRVVRWNDCVHHSVTFRRNKNYNNPPEGATVVDDSGRLIAKFKRV